MSGLRHCQLYMELSILLSSKLCLGTMLRVPYGAFSGALLSQSASKIQIKPKETGHALQIELVSELPRGNAINTQLA